MNHLYNLIKKEVKELLTPASVLPIVVMALVFASLGNLTGTAISESQESSATLAVINLDPTAENDSYAAFAIEVMAAYNVTLVYNGTSASEIEDALQAMKDQGAAALLIFDENFTTSIKAGEKAAIQVYWNMKGTGLFDSLSSAPVYNTLNVISSAITMELIEGQGSIVDAANATAPLVTYSNTILGDKEMIGIDPMTVSGLLDSQNMMMPILIMIIIVMVGGIIISSMGMEKENKTLETLLTLPVNRTTIVAGKLIGSASVGLVFGLIYMVGMAYYMQGFNLASADYDLAQYGLSLDLLDWAILALMMFMAILCALGLCMILGAFAKNYKAAQSLTLPISFLAMVPMFIVMFTDFNTLPLFLQVLVFAIPFSHPMMGMNNLMFDNTLLVYGGMVYLTVFTLATIFITVRLYKSDILLTGFRFKKDGSAMSLMKGLRRSRKV
ncbi:MAG: ABC transporter permease [Candidatus Methanomethylophilaceae archaeon]|nr:ABC transporter permease [Candidatus Methanomethylophilaceae archaeon]